MCNFRIYSLLVGVWVGGWVGGAGAAVQSGVGGVPSGAVCGHLGGRYRWSVGIGWAGGGMMACSACLSDPSVPPICPSLTTGN